MATIYKFEDLEIWQLAFSIYKKISEIAYKMKLNHDFRFADQIKSAAGSMMDNIAEGFERNSRLEYVNSLSVSKGESGELQSQLYRSLFDKYIDQAEFDEIYKEVKLFQGKTGNLIQYLNQSTNRGLKFRNRITDNKGKPSKQ